MFVGEHVSVCIAGPRACCFTPKWVALLFVCVIKYSALTLDGVSRQRYRKEKKQRERHSKRSPVSADLIRVSQSNKAEFTYSRKRSSTVPANSSNVAKCNYETLSEPPNKRRLCYCFNYALFGFISPQLKVSGGACKWENKRVLGSTLVILQQVQKLACRK